MKEQLIEFETAKLAKEKGFNESTYNWYRDDRNPNILYGRNAKKGGLVPPIKQGIANCLAPTQSLLQKWLREKHKIEIVALPYTTVDENLNPMEKKYIWMIHGRVSSTAKTKEHFETYEQALEKGLFEALKLIK